MGLLAKNSVEYPTRVDWKLFEFKDRGYAGDDDGSFIRRLFNVLFDERRAQRSDGVRLWGRVFIFCTECTTRAEVVEKGFVAASPFAGDEPWSRSVCLLTTCGHCERKKDKSWKAVVGFTPAVDWITDREIFRDVVRACAAEGVGCVEIVRRVLDRREIAGSHDWSPVVRFISTERVDENETRFVRTEYEIGWLG